MRLIDADALKPDYIVGSTSTNTKCYRYVSLNQIMNAPTADVRANVKGKWIATQEWGGRNYSCSCCKFSFIVDTCMYEPIWNYCPNCGAEMKGEE